MTAFFRPLCRRVAPLFLAAGLVIAPVANVPVRAQVPDPSATGEPGQEGASSGRPLDGYLATITLLLLVLFIVGKSARR
jgi:hypothetical protein